MSTIGRPSSSSSLSPSVLVRPRPGLPIESVPRCPVRPPPVVVKPKPPHVDGYNPHPHVDGYNPRPFGPDVRPTKPAVDPFHPLQPKPVSVKDGRPAVDPFDVSKFL